MNRLFLLYCFFHFSIFCHGQLNWAVNDISIIDKDTITFTLQAVLPPNTFLVNADSQNLNLFTFPPFFMVLLDKDSTTTTNLTPSNNPTRFSRKNYQTYGNGRVQFSATLVQSGISEQKNILGIITYSIITPNNKLKNHLFKFRLYNKSIQRKTIHVGYEGFRCFEFNLPSE